MLARVMIAATLAAIPAAPARAATAAPSSTTAHTRVVSADPVDTTPHVLDGIVNAIALVGRTVVVGGSFSEVSDAGRTTTLDRSNVFAYDLATGRILPGFAPEVDGPVHSLAAGEGGTVYVGGDFPEIDGEPARSLARLRLSDGAVVRGFTPRVSGGMVTSLARRGSHLYVGGDFTRPRTALARLNAATGTADPRFAITPSAPLTPRVKVTALALGRDRIAVDGTFTKLNGRSRPQLGLIDVSGATARLSSWRTSAYAPKCKKPFPSYIRGLAFSPDGGYFVVVSTGGTHRATTLCDTAARFETYSRAADVRPTWVNHTGGDSLYAVAVTGAAVYVGGHQRWLNNPGGSNTAGPGAVPREGIGAIHPRTGKALSWNPGRDRGIGVKAFLVHPGGLLVGSDTTRLGGEYHARIGMFPLP